MKRRVWRVVAALLALPLLVLLLLNLAVNLALPFALNGRPERAKITYSFAWTVVPGTVHVYGLRVRSQGLKDQWQLDARRAYGVIDLQSLRERRLRATSVQAEGASFRYRFRVEPGEVPSEADPPIAGLDNPPVPLPEDLYPTPNPWEIELPEARIGIRELWFGDYHYTGHARAEGSLLLGRAEIEADGALTFLDGGLQLGEQPVADKVSGKTTFTLDKLPRETGIGRSAMAFVSGTAALGAELRSLSFFHHYLERAPWLVIDGKGALQMDVAMDAGRFREGSWVSAQTQDLSVRFMSYDIQGDGVVRLEASDELGVPMSHMSVDFGAYTISAVDQPPLVEGTGFTVDALSPDLAMDEPFTTMDVVLELPESQVRNIELYNEFFPADIGFALTGGEGKVRGRLEVSTLDNVAEGDVYIDGDELKGRLDDLAITLDLSLHAKLSEGRLSEGLYNFSGSRLELRDVGLVDRSPDEGRKRDDIRSWWANVDIPSGQARVGKPVYLDATLALQCASSDPFVRVVAQRKEVAHWIQGLLSVPDVRGTGRVRLGADTVELDPFANTGGQYEVLLRWHRQRKTNHGAVFARYGALSVGVGVEGADQELHLLGARQWFEEGGKAQAADEDEADAEETEETEERKLARKQEKLERKEARRRQREESPQ